MKQPLKKNYDKVKEYIENGTSQTAIANIFGVSRQAAKQYTDTHFQDIIPPRGVCLKCGGSLENRRTGAKYCSDACCNRVYRETCKIKCTCILCGTVTMKIPPAKSQYCGTKCAHAAVIKLYPEKILERYANGETIKEIAKSLDSTPGSVMTSLYRHGFRLTGKIEKVCPKCDTSFLGTHKKIYCHPKCQKGDK